MIIRLSLSVAGQLALATARHHDSRLALSARAPFVPVPFPEERMFETPAFAASPGAASGGTAAFMVQIFPLILIFIIFYFLLIRPQQRRVKQHQAMVMAVKPRDTAITNGGLVGKVTKVDENEIELEIAQGVRVRVVKSMLSDIRPHGAKPAND
jgi:preprotein translocase subunit YajC